MFLLVTNFMTSTNESLFNRILTLTETKRLIRRYLTPMEIS